MARTMTSFVNRASFDARGPHANGAPMPEADTSEGRFGSIRFVQRSGRGPSQLVKPFVQLASDESTFRVLGLMSDMGEQATFSDVRHILNSPIARDHPLLLQIIVGCDEALTGRHIAEGPRA